jgi:hypothetical protein
MPYFANRKSVRWGILDRLFDFDELIAAAENRLFKRFSVNINHCLHLHNDQHAIFIKVHLVYG